MIIANTQCDPASQKAETEVTAIVTAFEGLELWDPSN